MAIEGDFSYQPLVILLCLMWILFSVPIFFPLAYKLTIENGSVKNSLFGIILMEVSAKNVESINYGGISLWNGIYPSRTIVHGKGLAILVYIGGVRKTYGLSEKLYGKEAIENVRNVLGR